MSQNRINILPEDVANKIAAGEVVERPASVVKELVENAIDAGSTKILVDVEVGGRKRIRVTDNGSGMSPQDAVNAFKRHATSKLRSADDLNHIVTLGFRGEALPSIASVAKVELQTRTDGAPSGTRLRIEGGSLLEHEPCGCPVGTQLDVARLFFNTPARYKFLKTTTTEMRHITAHVTRQAIAHPEISFRLTHDDRNIFDYAKATDSLARLRDVFGSETAEQLIMVKNEQYGIRLWGFVGNQNATRKNKDYQYLYINQRYIRNPVITRALYDGYGSALVKGRHPVAVLFMEIDPEWVDVNVHPTKEEVRFSDGQTIYRVVYHAVKNAFQIATESIPEHLPGFFEIENKDQESGVRKQGLGVRDQEAGVREQGSSSQKLWQFPNQPRHYRPSRQHVDAAISAYREPTVDFGENTPPPADDLDRLSPTAPPTPHFRVLGQLHRCYILAEFQNGLWLVDQHVAHERILYDEAMAAQRGQTFPSQRLLFPITLNLSAEEYQRYQEVQPILQNLGFQITPTDGRTVHVEGIPTSIRRWKDGQALRDLLDASDEDPPPVLDDAEWVINQYSCKNAIKKGDPLNPTEMEILLKRLFATENPYTCQHHRPIILEITLTELDRKFGRNT